MFQSETAGRPEGVGVSDIAAWLEKHGLGMHVAAFESNHIETDTLRELTEADLRELGLSIGHRRKLMQVKLRKRDISIKTRPNPSAH